MTHTNHEATNMGCIKRVMENRKRAQAHVSACERRIAASAALRAINNGLAPAAQSALVVKK